jgi:hypothetical protein
MKKMMITIGLFLVLSPIFAENDKPIIREETKIEINIIDLQPVTPKEATFEDDTLVVKSLAPITPKEATFEDAK